MEVRPVFVVLVLLFELNQAADILNLALPTESRSMSHMRVRNLADQAPSISRYASLHTHGTVNGGRAIGFDDQVPHRYPRNW